MAAAAILYNFEWPYLRNGSRSTYHLCYSTALLFTMQSGSCKTIFTETPVSCDSL